jgi:hypothetical protein
MVRIVARVGPMARRRRKQGVAAAQIGTARRGPIGSRTVRYWAVETRLRQFELSSFAPYKAAAA